MYMQRYLSLSFVPGRGHHGEDGAVLCTDGNRQEKLSKPCADQRDGGESPSGWGWAELPSFPMQGCPATEGRFNCRLVIKNSKNSTP